MSKSRRPIPRFRSVAGDPAATPDRPERFVLPRPISNIDLAMIGDAASQALNMSADRAIHVIAIAKSGYPIADALLHALSSMQQDRPVYLSGVDIHAPINDFDPIPEPDPYVILVDNSVTTGTTAGRALNLLRQSNVLPSVFIKLVRYSDAREAEISAFLSAMYEIDVVSLYSSAECKVSARSRSHV